jgi:Methionine synthase II (cobalamin-independent)
MLRGDRAVLGLLLAVPVGTLTLELCTPRAGELEVLAGLPEDRRLGVGVLNQKEQRVETPEEILARAEPAVALFGAERVLVNPDCGFATFADNPIVAPDRAAAKLTALVEARDRRRDAYPNAN